jgi:hypothetical protein
MAVRMGTVHVCDCCLLELPLFNVSCSTYVMSGLYCGVSYAMIFTVFKKTYREVEAKSHAINLGIM